MAERERPDELSFAAWLDGRLVGTSGLVDRHGIAGVYAATGSALTAAALSAGRRLGVATLQASPMEARMGSEPVAAFWLFAWAQ